MHSDVQKPPEGQGWPVSQASPDSKIPFPHKGSPATKVEEFCLVDAALCTEVEEEEEVEEAVKEEEEEKELLEEETVSIGTPVLAEEEDLLEEELLDELGEDEEELE